MSRPAHANLDATRARLVEVALPRFAEHGYEGTSVREVVSAARVNLSMISHCFGGKRGLYEETVDEVYRRLGERGRGASATPCSSTSTTLMAQLYATRRAPSATACACSCARCSTTAASALHRDQALPARDRARDPH